MQTSEVTASGLEHEYSYSNICVMFYSLQNTFTECATNSLSCGLNTEEPTLGPIQLKFISHITALGSCSGQWVTLLYVVIQAPSICDSVISWQSFSLLVCFKVRFI